MNMNRYFVIYHNLVPSAPWGVTVEREHGSPKAELLLLTRTEKEASQLASLTCLGDGLKQYRDAKVNPEPKGQL
jgi:hypothetical protein